MTAETAESRALRNLAGATVLQALPAMRDDQAGRATLEMAIALLRSVKCRSYNWAARIRASSVVVGFHWKHRSK